MNVLLAGVVLFAVTSFVIGSPIPSEPVSETNGLVDCTVDFIELETALYNNGKNRRALLTAFYPPKHHTSIFISKVEYVFVNDNGTEVSRSLPWKWSAAAFYFVQPLIVFQYTSLFVGQYANRVYRNLTLYLPDECLKQSSNLHERKCNANDMLDILTRRVSHCSACINYCFYNSITNYYKCICL